VRTNIEQLRNPGKKFVERHDQSHDMFLIASVAASRSSAKSEGEAINTRYVSALNDIGAKYLRAVRAPDRGLLLPQTEATLEASRLQRSKDCLKLMELTSGAIGSSFKEWGGKSRPGFARGRFPSAIAN
jgi:hypothetical protein